MEYSDEQLKAMEEFINVKEQHALELYRQSASKSSHELPKEIKEALETAFLIGYGYGGIEYEEDLRKLQKNDPISFYKWIEGSL